MTTTNMTRLLVFRRTRRNHNSFAALSSALGHAGLSRQLRVAFADQPLAYPEKTEALLFSFVTPELATIASELSEIRRKRSPVPLLVAGGPHASADPQGTLRLGFDVVFVGEAERTFPAFAAAWLERPKATPPIVSASGPAFDLNQKIHADVRHGLFPFVEISRGCPHNCKFCQVSSIFGRGMRHRSPQVVAEGIAQAVRAGYRRFRYLTPDAFAYRSGLGTSAQALEELLSCGARAGANEQMLGTFPSEVRPDRVTPALLQVVSDRCTNRTLVIGAQSGSDRVLGLMNRGHTVEQARQAIFDIRQAGLKPHVDILFCFPGEQLQERRDSLNLIRWCVEQARAKIHAHVYLPLPGTSAWPDSPCVMEEEIKLKLKELKVRGVLDGDWEHQAAQGRQILRWREEGKILAEKL